MLAFLPQLYYLLIYLLCHFYHLVYALLPGRAGGVGAVGNEMIDLLPVWAALAAARSVSKKLCRIKSA